MTLRIKQAVTLVFGLAAVAVGVWRHLQTGDSPQAAWFGLVMGVVAMVGSALFFMRSRIPGYLVTWVSLIFVSGWFLWRMLSGHSDGTSIRVIFILVVCAVELVVLLIPCRSAGISGSASDLQASG